MPKEDEVKLYIERNIRKYLKKNKLKYNQKSVERIQSMYYTLLVYKMYTEVINEEI